MNTDLLSDTEFNQGLLNFISASPTPFHAVRQMAESLEEAGFQRLLESKSWNLKNGCGYYVTRNDSALIAFRIGRLEPARTGIRMVGAHTDSPCLKIKPRPERINQSYLQLGVEVYGGALLNPWFDRDLSLAGRVTCLRGEKTIKSFLIDFQRPIATIPSLAIHLEREANRKHTINAQKHLPPVIMQITEEAATDTDKTQIRFNDILLKQLKNQYPDTDTDNILAYELNLYDTQPPSLLGLNNEFIAGARLDNLASCYTGLISLIHSTQKGEVSSSLLICNDHEEVGSLSTTGAQGPFLKSVLKRICPLPEDCCRIRDRSIMISSDNAHGIHPNYADKFDSRHAPILNRGPVIKINANQRYASNSETIALFRYLCLKAAIPVQDFVVRSDMTCGSTIGPLTAAVTGIKTVDIGVPTFGMHSIRELAGSLDCWYLYRALRAFWETEITFEAFS